MAPTLGQSVLTFVLQILGTAFGTLVGMAFLYIWRGVGDYIFNPFGLTVFIAIYSIPLMTIIYTKPMFFPGALLALNGLGVLGQLSSFLHRPLHHLFLHSSALSTTADPHIT